VDPDDATPFAAELRRLRATSGLSLRGLASRVHHGKSFLHELECGHKHPTPAVARRLDEALGGDGRLIVALNAGSRDPDESELEALELARRVSASDVSHETLERLEQAADAMAMAYATTPPAELLPRVSRYLAYVGTLLEARKTLDHHRRLLVAGGWLALLRATLHIDLRHDAAANAFLVTAGQLASHADHPEITAWCLETKAWDVVTTGDYRQAVELSRRAQAVAPRDGSAIVQATAQEGRAWARLGDRKQTRVALERVNRLVAVRSAPDQPEHHYRYDPAKAMSYAATTLSWAGDPAAEPLAREVIADLEADATRPRRAASARLDLGLALLAANKPDEAAATAITALASGRIVPSNWWRATEVVSGVTRSGIPEAADLRDAYELHAPTKRP
jgi:tetratricopeptide (TPR) repeat protein